MSSLSDAGSVAVVAAMVQEMRPVVRRLHLKPTTVGDHPAYAGAANGRDVVAVVTSMGTRAATEVTESLLTNRAVDHVVVIGICGAISPDVEIGSLVVPTETMLEDSGRTCTPTVLGAHTPAGRLLTTDKLHNDPDEVRALYEQGFVAVDMETGAIGAVCEDRGVPWSVFRAASDRAGDPLVDPALMSMTNADGSPAPSQVVRYLVRHPRRIPQLARLGRGMKAAVDTATGALLDVLT